MPVRDLDTAAIARSLAQIADRPGDLADVFFERSEEVELPPEGEAPGLRVRQEEGLAVRLVREGSVWLASADGWDGRLFAEALRRVARALPAASYPEPELGMEPLPRPCEAPELLEFPAALQREIRGRHAAFPLRLTLRRHRRWIQVVGPRLVPEPERERFYSCAVELPWGRYGSLLATLDGAAGKVAAALVEFFAAREAPPPQRQRGVVVLAPPAAAVFLHEAVAHALEVDTLALKGGWEPVLGTPMGGEGLHVLDDPAAAPEEVRRATDDEGMPVVRRWLLRGGVVAQPLADAAAASDSPDLTPGAGRRSSRHAPPGPRSYHLELLAGEGPEAELVAEAEGGLYVPDATAGALDPYSGEFRLSVPHGRRIRGGGPAEAVGPFLLHGRVGDWLRALTAIGPRSEVAGAGWCAKSGQRLPVWATTPALRLEGVEVGP